MEKENREGTNQGAPEKGKPAAETAQAADFVKSPCKALAAKRQELGLSEEEVASKLKVTVRQIQAMEAGDFGAFHGVAIARGFVRAYAKMMGLDPEPLVAFFAKGDGAAPSHKNVKSAAVAPGSTQSFEDNQMIFRRPSGGGKKILWFIVLLIIVLLGVAWYMKLIPWQKPTPKAPVVEKKVPAPEPVKEVPAASAVTASQEAPKADAKDAQAAGAPTDATMAPLAIKFSGASWVQIQSEDGKKTIAQFTSKPGEVKKMDIQPPAIIVIGNTKGVASMEYRNASVDVDAVSKGNTAKIPLK